MAVVTQTKVNLELETHNIVSIFLLK
jgi:hypothetical protein